MLNTSLLNSALLNGDSSSTAASHVGPDPSRSTIAVNPQSPDPSRSTIVVAS